MANKVIGFEIVIDGLGKTVETATELKRAIAQVNEEIKKTSDVQELKKLEGKLIDLKAAQMEVTKVTREQIKTRNEEITGIDKANGAYRKLSKELNDQRNRYKDLAAAEQDTSQEAKDLLVSINALDKKLKGIDATVGQFQRNVGGYTEALSQFFPKLGGTIGNVTGLVGDLSSGFANLGKTSGIANIGLGAVGLALAAFEGISSIISELNQAASEINDLKLSLENFGVAAEDLDLVASRAKTIGDVFKVSANEVASAANTLVKEFGVPIEQAFDVIQAGFLKGANSQGEFLQELKEFPAQFKLAKIGIDEFLAVSIDSANKGIFSDKALDAIKEFGKQVRDQSSASRDALVAAFGEDFTNNLFQNIKNGSVTSGEALKLVTKEIKETGVNSVDLQRLVSTLFVGAGEDAGEYVLSLGDVLNKTDNLYEADTELQKQLERNLQVTQELNLETSKYSESVAEAEIRRKEFTSGLKNLGLVLYDIFIFFVQPFTGTINEIIKASKKGYEAIKFIAEEGAAIIGKSFSKNSQNELKTLEDNGKKQVDLTKKVANEKLKVGSEAWRKQEEELERQRELSANKLIADTKANAEMLLKTEDGISKAISDKKAKRSTIVFGTPEFKKLDAEIKQLEKELDKFNPKDSGKKGGQDFVKSFVEGSLAQLQQSQRELQNSFSNASIGSATQKEIAIKLNAINNQIKDAVEQQNQIIADASRGNLLKNLQNAKPLTTLPVPTKPLQSIKQSDIAKKDAEDLKKVQEDIIKNSNEANLKRIENEKKAEQELYENRQKNIALAGEAAMALTNLFSTIQQAKLKKDADILNEEIRKTEENIALLEGKAERANGLKKKRLQKEIEAEKALLIEKNKQAEALQLKGAKEEKKIAIIQSIIQGALAVQRALSFPPGPPATIPSAIGTGVLSAIQTATIIAQPLAQGGVVTGERVNQKQNIPTRSNGDNVLAYVKRGEVVLNQRQQAMLGGSPTFRKIGIKGFADGGIVPPISAPMSITEASSDMKNILAMLDSKTDAINSRIDRLQAYVVSDDIARDLAEGNKLRINATL